MHCHTVWGQWVVQFLRYTASLIGRSGERSPQRPGPTSWGTGSPARAAVGAHGAPAGDGNLQRPRPTGWGDGESYRGGGRCLWSACGGRLRLAARAH